jgi:signal transduction histidine kinase
MKSALLKRFSIQQKFIFVTFVAVIILMVIIGLYITGAERTIMYRDMERQGRLLADTLSIPIVNALLYEKIGLIEEGGLIDNYVMEMFGKKDVDLIYIAILDESGLVVSHNDFNEYGKVYNDDMTSRGLSAYDTVVQKFYSDKLGHEALDFATPLSIGKKRFGTLKFAVSLEKAEQEMRIVIIRVIALTILLLAGGLIIIIFLSRRFLGPITELSQTMEKAGGDMLDVKVNIEGSDEISHLGQSFNLMIDRIREANLELKQTHEKLLTFASTIEKTGGDTLDVKVDIEGSDEIAHLGQSFNLMIDRIREANLELKRTHEKLLRSEKLASIGILASGVAHEINNPLGGLFNCIEMLEQAGDDKEFRQRYQKLLKKGLNRIENTVGKLLYMSRKEDKNVQAVGMKESLEDIYEFLEYRMKNSGIVYRENVEDGVSVIINPHDLQQVLINLMINAVQSMNNGGTLSVNAYQNNAKVILEVTDTGKGIEEEDLNKVFDPFYTTKQPGEGTGLGLWLAYEIVQDYGGEISVKSKKDVGTTFTVELNRVG